MTEVETYKSKYDLKELELNSLLEITQAINNNMPEDSLYKIYGFTLRANLNIKKLALFVLDDQWECKVNYGTATDFQKITIDNGFLDFNKIQRLSGIRNTPFAEFHTVIPVAHKERKLAFVFLHDSDEPGKDAINTNFIQALSNIIIVAIENKKLARKQMEQEMIKRELEIAGNMQHFLFPKKLPNQPGLQVATYYKPHHSIGGDYYDFIETSEGQILFCVADVSGKGIPAALLMSNFQASLRTITRQTTLLQEIVTELNHQVISNAEGQHFITFFIALYDKSFNRLKYVNCGHNPPFLIRDREKVEMLMEGTTILGIFPELPFLNIGIIEPIEEFTVCAFTDGLTEIMNADGVEFGQQPLTDIVEQNLDSDPETLNMKIISAMEEFRGKDNMHDDVTLFTCYINSKLL